LKVEIPVPIADVGRRARLDLRFAHHHGRTILADSYCEVPFKFTRLIGEQLILMHSTAGVFGGDDLEASIHVESGARVVITQQSATKIHPSISGSAAVQRTRITVDDGAELQIYFEPLIPFAGSRLRQSTAIDVAPGGRLFYWEGFMTGRVGRGESWEFDELATETSLSSKDQLLYLDRFRLLREQDMGNVRYVGTGLCFSQEAARLVEKLHELMPEAGVDIPAENVVAVRTGSETGPEYHRYRQLFSEVGGHAGCE
jgi:urease accessory protein UreH